MVREKKVLEKKVRDKKAQEKNKRRIRDKSATGSSIIWEGSVIEGNISGADDFIVYGTVVGDADIGGTLVLQPSARWQGNISAANVVLAGVVDGSVVAR